MAYRNRCKCSGNFISDRSFYSSTRNNNIFFDPAGRNISFDQPGRNIPDDQAGRRQFSPFSTIM